MTSAVDRPETAASATDGSARPRFVRSPRRGARHAERRPTSPRSPRRRATGRWFRCRLVNRSSARDMASCERSRMTLPPREQSPHPPIVLPAPRLLPRRSSTPAPRSPHRTASGRRRGWRRRQRWLGLRGRHPVCIRACRPSVALARPAASRRPDDRCFEPVHWRRHAITHARGGQVVAGGRSPSRRRDFPLRCGPSPSTDLQRQGGPRTRAAQAGYGTTATRRASAVGSHPPRTPPLVRSNGVRGR
jgi:hypothetical protein